MRFFLRKFLVPLILILLAVTWIAKDQIINRQFSNTGHINLFIQGWHYFTDYWLTGMGAASVGPGSHFAGGLNFNPENQYLQIAIEFGIVGFILWMIRYLFLHRIGRTAFKNNLKNKIFSQKTNWLIACSIGMVGLSISGLVLHSFTDRMIVYPFMLIFGIVYYLYHNEPATEREGIALKVKIKKKGRR